MNIRIRYGKTSKNDRKNTLATIRRNDLIYFGIARCHSKMDVFDRVEGKMRAYEQLIQSLADNLAMTTAVLSYFMVTPDGKRGYISINNVPKLLQYFEGIDDRYGKPWPALQELGALQLK